jgi:hypothetical protein
METGFYFRPGHLLGVWSVCCHRAVGPSRLGRFVGGKSNLLAAFAPGPGMGTTAFFRHGNAIPSGSIFTHPRASGQMTPPPSSSRTRAGIVWTLNFSISAFVRAFIPALLLALCHIDIHVIVKL